jgi:predicted ArsR family transcriptional regulator
VARGARICTTRIGRIGHVPTSPSFTATVSAITDAFGDPTRRTIYLFAKERFAKERSGEPAAGEPAGGEPAGVTASMVATEVGIHPNVARHHLDKLAAGGYLEVVSGKVIGAGAGRPSKRYVVVGDAFSGENAQFPVRSDDLLLSLLGRALDRLPHDEAEMIAEEVGQEYGRAMAGGLTGDSLTNGRRSLRSAMQAVADALTAHGFAAHAEGRNGRMRIINDHCPFGDVATDHPVICAVDRGMVKGMLAALVGDGDAATRVDVVSESSVARGDTVCSTAV